MIGKELTVTSVDRVSAYHVNKLVTVASAFDSTVSYEAERKKANGKSIIGLISMQLKKGAPFTVVCDGPDEREALAAVERAIAELR